MMKQLWGRQIYLFLGLLIVVFVALFGVAYCMPHASRKSVEHLIVVAHSAQLQRLDANHVVMHLALNSSNIDHGLSYRDAPPQQVMYVPAAKLVQLWGIASIHFAQPTQSLVVSKQLSDVFVLDLQHVDVKDDEVIALFAFQSQDAAHREMPLSLLQTALSQGLEWWVTFPSTHF